MRTPYCSLVYPTLIRSTGQSAGTIMGRFGSIAAPYVADLLVGPLFVTIRQPKFIKISGIISLVFTFSRQRCIPTCRAQYSEWCQFLEQVSLWCCQRWRTWRWWIKCQNLSWRSCNDASLLHSHRTRVYHATFPTIVQSAFHLKLVNWRTCQHIIMSKSTKKKWKVYSSLGSTSGRQ